MIKKTIEEFKNESNIEIIEELMKINDGYITSKQITSMGIHRMYLKMMIDKKMIEKISRGIYIDNDIIEDIYYVFQLKHPKIIFSRMTALYFHNLTEVYPSNFDITISYNYHVEEINKNHSVIKCNEKTIELGLITIKTPLGHEIRAYDPERCICDIIRFRNRLDLEQVKKSVKKYINSKDKNINKLMEYSKKLKVYKQVINFVGAFYE